MREDASLPCERVQEGEQEAETEKPDVKDPAAASEDEVGRRRPRMRNVDPCALEWVNCLCL